MIKLNVLEIFEYESSNNKYIFVITKLFPTDDFNSFLIKFYRTDFWINFSRRIYGLRVVDNALAVLTVFQSKEVVQILAGADSADTEGSCCLKDLKNQFSSISIAVGTDELPTFINENGFFLGAVGFGFVPDIIEGYEHAHCQQVACQLGNVKYRVLVIQ